LTTDTHGLATDRYTGSFGGTSGSAAIVAGAALILQSVRVARLGSRFTPDQVRAILGDPANGTWSSNPAADRIGVMPDLRKILINEFGIT
jgi:serine protease